MGLRWGAGVLGRREGGWRGRPCSGLRWGAGVLGSREGGWRRRCRRGNVPYRLLRDLLRKNLNRT